jgi:hypothetical protein
MAGANPTQSLIGGRRLASQRGHFRTTAHTSAIGATWTSGYVQTGPRAGREGRGRASAVFAAADPATTWPLRIPEANGTGVAARRRIGYLPGELAFDGGVNKMRPCPPNHNGG